MSEPDALHVWCILPDSNWYVKGFKPSASTDCAKDAYGTRRQIRTGTVTGLSRFSLPIGVREHVHGYPKSVVLVPGYRTLTSKTQPSISPESRG